MFQVVLEHVIKGRRQALGAWQKPKTDEKKPNFHSVVTFLFVLFLYFFLGPSFTVLGFVAPGASSSDGLARAGVNRRLARRHPCSSLPGQKKCWDWPSLFWPVRCLPTRERLLTSWLALTWNSTKEKKKRERVRNCFPAVKLGLILMQAAQ